MSNERPILGISMGDPAGIGPEIAAKVFGEKTVFDICRPFVVGDYDCMVDAAHRICKMTDLKVIKINEVSEAKFEFGTMEVLHVDCVDMSKLEFGKVSAMAGNAAFVCVKKLIELALEDKVDGTITGPLNKESMNMAGHHYSGHTEIYAEYCKTKDYCMFLAHGNLRVSHVSTHVSLREACDRVKKQRVLRVIELTDEACKAFGIAEPKIGVAGLNPHSGENGMFGTEEINEITPAIQEATAKGMVVEGPVPPDTLYSKANGGLYDAAIAMYHDQGHIPLKVVGFVWNDELKRWNSVAGVNITLGLPIVRSSVDHGTAFGKAGKGTATHESLMHAIEYGVKLSNYRKMKKGNA